MAIQSFETGKVAFVEVPSFEEVVIYFCQKGIPWIEAHHFYFVHHARGWRKRNGSPVKRWKAAAYEWITISWKIDRALFDRSAH